MKPLSPATLSLAYAADIAFGDPERLPHPVRLIGRFISCGERQARPGSSVRRDFVAGLALTSVTVCASYLAGSLATMTWPVEAALIWTTLGTGNLITEASAVVDALEAGDLQRSRSLVGRIVGRDTATLNSSDVSRAVIETLAESLCDGVVAPLFYLALGGAPLAMAYKAINTLDSMIGHIEHPYTYFGRAAARLDDGANFLPARLTAFFIVAAAATIGRSGNAISVWIADGDKHPSPNAGQSEAAMAGALGVRLGGVNHYGGTACAKPELGPSYQAASIRHARVAMGLTRIASLLAFACALAYTARRRPT